MNIFRIVQKRTNRRKQDENPYREIPAVLLFVFLLPYVISCLWGHIGEEMEVFYRTDEEDVDWNDTHYEVVLSGNWGKKRMTMQEYLIRKLEMIMPEDEDETAYELEALKAQAVLLRTELWENFLIQETSSGEPLMLQDEAFWHQDGEADGWEMENPYRQAVLETDGIFLSYEGKPVKAAFFQVSGGQTRDAAEALRSEKYPYLISTECSQDIMAADYQSRIVLSKKAYCEMAAPLFAGNGEGGAPWAAVEFSYDSAGYVMEATCRGSSCNGETFRYALGLPSACFRAEWGEEEVTFYVKGVGHGFGMSQYGANRKALEGETFDNILADYFFQAELVKIE